MDHCPKCATAARHARVICAGCGEVLPLRVVVVSEGSRGGGFALVEMVTDPEVTDVCDKAIQQIETEDEEASL